MLLNKMWNCVWGRKWWVSVSECVCVRVCERERVQDFPCWLSMSALSGNELISQPHTTGCCCSPNSPPSSPLVHAHSLFAPPKCPSHTEMERGRHTHMFTFKFNHPRRNTRCMILTSHPPFYKIPWIKHRNTINRCRFAQFWWKKKKKWLLNSL